MGIIEHRIPLPARFGKPSLSAFNALMVIKINRMIHECNQ